MKIAFFPCNNGLGHIKRSLELATYLDVNQKIDFYSKDIKKYEFKLPKNIKLKEIDSPKNLKDFKKKNYPKWIFNKNLDKYKFVYSDTLNEIYLKSDNVVLFANFFWNIIYNHRSIIFNKINKSVRNKKIFTNYLFYHKPSMKNRNFSKVGFFGKFLRKKHLINKNILISIGTASLNKLSIIKKELREIIKDNNEFIFFLDRSLYKSMKSFKNTELAIHDKHMFDNISFAIIKPGFSIISECLKNGIPIFCFDKYQNKEFKYNSKIITFNKLGFKSNDLSAIVNKIKKMNDLDIKRTFTKFKKLKWNGEKIIINEFKKR